MSHLYMAEGVTILTFSESEQDDFGTIIPSEAIATFPDKIKVTYGDEDSESVIGHAFLTRTSNEVTADFTLRSSMKDTKKCLGMLAKLSPAVSFTVSNAEGNKVLGLKIVELFLTPFKNDDTSIEPLGDKVRLVKVKKDMH